MMDNLVLKVIGSCQFCDYQINTALFTFGVVKLKHF